jgi:Methyltransferase domain
MNAMWAAIQRLQVPSATTYTGRIVGDCIVAFDVGCGVSSPLTNWPHLHTIGVDVSPESIEKARANGAHDEYRVADVLDDGLDVTPRPDLVALYGVIEHLPKRRGLELLERCEALTTKYVLLETPNGFIEQGPEFGNVAQRHLSGWFPHDFEGLGYEVFGSSGMKSMMGYAGSLRWNIPGMGLVNALLARAVRIEKRPRFAFNLVAIKDVRGVPPRL